ncbi:3-methylornithyl-N6-L-lysine dehydrogenase PylD [Sporomusa acidovorans]|uniref:Pyrrolysine biosynthesis protein PylD n=1 Tax=Sporomusa acidovorans (strain ATCC 49682 / DSM 3132 / Mol) TaxID=1123286 RepID=A0ABZ3J7E0_SPOA4|nr:3-methylornithyl-N6-L-lysine dehydrogenase PylD [Sporomusa acidovorans]OZC21249.1 shikimate 5-dehydrogenase [Sporomusa acidovorans DSM 3132]SDE65864.1 pyrrolysine biosynthesis protein PylD [Sporomusa acidovorans]
MTRLCEKDIDGIACRMEQYDQELINKTGHTLAEIAAHAAGMEQQGGEKIYDPGLVAVIPMTCGQGIIGGFTEAVAGILSFLEMRVFIPRAGDVNGIAAALAREAKILFMADDDRFIAVHLKSGRCIDNGEATGKGYVAALDYMLKGVNGQRILILGAGPVGCAAAFAAVNFGGNVAVYDKKAEASERMAQDIFNRYGRKICIEQDLKSALTNHHAIVVACPEAGFITQEVLAADSYVAAPGIPLGVCEDAREQIQNRLLHDPLQIGVATMLYECLKRSDYHCQGDENR